MGITAQNMPYISNSLLSLPKSMVAMGNQWWPRKNSDGTWSSKTIMGLTTQNMP